MPKQQIMADAMQRMGDKAEMILQRFGPIEEAMLTACNITGALNAVIVIQGQYVDESGTVMEVIQSRNVGGLHYKSKEVAAWLDVVKEQLLSLDETVTEDGVCADCGRGIDNGQS